MSPEFRGILALKIQFRSLCPNNDFLKENQLKRFNSSFQIKQKELVIEKKEYFSMSEMVQKKVEMKFFKTSLQGSEAQAYAAGKDIRISRAPKDTFFMGEIFIDKEIYGMLGLQKEYWAEESTAQELDSFDRIVIKLYSRKGRSVGVIEERILKELAQSAVSGDLPVFTITLSGFPYVIDIEKESSKLVFPMLTDSRKGFFDIFQIAKKSLAMGADFIVTRKLGNEKVAFIDSKRGGKVEIEIYNDDLADNSSFVHVLALFASTVQYHEAIANKIKSTVKALEDGTIALKPSKDALELMMNPRKAKRGKSSSSEEESGKKKRTRKKRKIRGTDAEEEDEEKPRKKKKTLKKKKKTDDTEKYKELHLTDPIKKASGVGTKTAGLLMEIGIRTVEDLLSADAEEIATLLEEKSITTTKVKKWQSASRKRVKSTFELDTADSDETDDYELMDYQD